MRASALFPAVTCLMVACSCLLRSGAEVAFTNLYSFSGTNGIEPEGTLVQAPNGDFYGTTRETTATSGGNWGFGAYGHGTVFKITTNGILTTLAFFTNVNGAFPRAGLVFGRDGNLYGTTMGGGASGLGTVFRVTPTGSLTVLASFAGTNGSQPASALLEGDHGIFYGTKLKEPGRSAFVHRHFVSIEPQTEESAKHSEALVFSSSSK